MEKNGSGLAFLRKESILVDLKWIYRLFPSVFRYYIFQSNIIEILIELESNSFTTIREFRGEHEFIAAVLL